MAQTPLVTVFEVDLPQCRGCPFTDGVSSQVVLIKSYTPATTTWNAIASAMYNYIAPPAIVSVRFRQGLSSLKTTFDSKTDRMGLDLSTVFNCELVLNTAGLGASSKCMWQSEFDLIISFGTDPTVVPGDLFILRSSALNSLDELSHFAAEHQIKAEILAPTLHAPLGPITIKSNSEIDTCTTHLML